MFTKFRAGESSTRHCGTSPMPVEHFPQDCRNRQNPRAETEPADTPVKEKNLRPCGEPRAYGGVRPSYLEFLSERTTKKSPSPPPSSGSRCSPPTRSFLQCRLSVAAAGDGGQKTYLREKKNHYCWSEVPVVRQHSNGQSAAEGLGFESASGHFSLQKLCITGTVL